MSIEVEIGNYAWRRFEICLNRVEICHSSMSSRIIRAFCQSPPRFAQSVKAAFLVIFLAEWGDLTQLATATLAAQYHAPITIFGAATLALWVVTAIGVGVGSYLKHWINPALIQRGAALAFATAGAVLLVHP